METYPLWQTRALVALESAILAKRQITYQSLAITASIPEPYRISTLTSWLEELIAEDAAAGLPLRAACVISKVRGIPAPGFFDCCAQHSLITENEDRADFYQRCLSALWKRS
tara:strand:+ start:70 stop:405 length:336 start_codon:yes stop_codon:yes gene_type:complete